MKLLAPVNSAASARYQIDSGADELYVGLKVPFLSKISFGGRGDRGWGARHVLPDRDEFRKILQLAHFNDVPVFFAANSQYLADGESGRWIAEYLEQVRWVEKQGVEGIILADLGAALFLKEHGIKIPFIASNYFDPVNRATLRLLADLGFVRVTLPYQIRMEEILDFAQAGIIELEVFANGGCSLLDGLCGFKPHGEMVTEVPIPRVGIPCHNLYQVTRDGAPVGSADRCLSDNRYCSICSLPKLMEAKIAGIKLVGRTQVIEKNAPLAMVFRKALRAFEKGADIDEVRREVIPFWWKTRYCSAKRCKYNEK